MSAIRHSNKQLRKKPSWNIAWVNYLQQGFAGIPDLSS